MKNVANKKTERKYKLNKTLLVNEKVINIKHQIIRLLSFSITIQYGDRLECHPAHRFFSDDLCRNEPINARQLRANGVWSRLINNFSKGLRDRTCKPLKSQRDMSNQCMYDRRVWFPSAPKVHASEWAVLKAGCFYQTLG